LTDPRGCSLQRHHCVRARIELMSEVWLPSIVGKGQGRWWKFVKDEREGGWRRWATVVTLRCKVCYTGAMSWLLTSHFV